MVISVSSTPPTSEAPKNFRPITSTKVRHIIANRAVPDTSASRFSNRFMGRADQACRNAGSGGRRPDPARGHLLQLGDLVAKLLQYLLRVLQAFLLGHRDPGVLEAGGTLLDFANEGGVGSDALYAFGLLERDAAAVVGFPELAIVRRGGLSRELLDDLLVLLRDAIPGVGIHHEGEAGVVEPSRNLGTVLDQLLELEGPDRLGREEHAVHHAGGQQFIGLRRRLE